MTDQLILASASPRRKKILEALGLTFRVVIPECDETLHDDNPTRTVSENALLKNRWCREHHPEAIILSADTIVVFEGRIIEKPVSLDQAKSFLRTFSGKKQKVLTAVAVSRPDQVPSVRVVESTVTFKVLSDETIENYFTFVNPMDKAGAYDVDQYGDIVIESCEGSYSNVMGLPAETASTMLGIS